MSFCCQDKLILICATLLLSGVCFLGLLGQAVQATSIPHSYSSQRSASAQLNSDLQRQIGAYVTDLVMALTRQKEMQEAREARVHYTCQEDESGTKCGEPVFGQEDMQTMGKSLIKRGPEFRRRRRSGAYNFGSGL
ncbi:unnamed protein product [Protopolystoma xenopodis]|uniref:Uncharacterized protein n=1 Tax=Protopolystoma xenopodis TaxID=117903 RepID=A0A448XD00_9PLAT|nr:unnamed protein product [Protopolystoma xenopodis]